MGRVKVPRCDNCGAPVEFAQGVLEARCEYCNEVLIRELPMAPAPPPPAPAPLPQRPAPSPVAARKATVWPFLVVGVTTLVLAGGSSVASFLASVRPLPEPAAEARGSLTVAPQLNVERGSVVGRQASPREDEASERSRAPDAGTTRTRRLARPLVSAAPTVVEPPKPPPFDTQAAVAGLDAAKLKAEASCKSTSGVRLFVNMGFDPDGANRGASVSDAKLKSTPEAKCALRIFRAVRIPAFDPATRPGGLGRPVRL